MEIKIELKEIVDGIVYRETDQIEPWCLLESMNPKATLYEAFIKSMRRIREAKENPISKVSIPTIN